MIPLKPLGCQCRPGLFALAVLVIVSLTSSLHAARGRPYINAAKTTFVADNGQLIRGAIISTETGNVPTLAAVQAIKNQGLNAIHCYAERSDYGYAAGAKKLALDAVVQMTRDNGLYLVITIGGGGVNKSFIDDFWTFYAPLYKNETHVIYEIQNEPVVRAPVSASVIAMEKDAYNIIRYHAPNTPVLLMSYTIFQNSAGVLADIAALSSVVNWNNAAIAFHGYGENGAAGTRACLVAVLAAGYPCFQTEFYRWPWGTGDFDLVDDPSLCQDVDQTGDLERLGVSWLSFLPLGKVTINARYRDRLANGGVTWTPDFGSWPAANRSVYGNGGEPRAIRSTATTRIEAEDFDNGGQGVSYNDNSTGNAGGAYRSTDVDVQTCTDAGGGYNLGWIVGGEWLEYTTLVANAGRYTINVRVSSNLATSKLRLKLAGVDLTGEWTVPNTGAYTTWTTLSKTVDLTPGQQLLRLEVVASGFNINYIEFVPVTAGAITNGTYKILNRNGSKAMDVIGASTANGAKIQQWGYSATANQKWVLTHRGANQYTITSSQTGKAIDQAAGQILSGDFLQMYNLNSSSANQRWIPVATSGGYFKLVSANTGLVMEVNGASTANGALIYQKEYAGGTHQQWLIGAP
ncbi:MAG: RICIN domain-containing protein [Rariglobus sp.]